MKRNREKPENVSSWFNIWFLIQPFMLKLIMFKSTWSFFFHQSWDSVISCSHFVNHWHRKSWIEVVMWTFIDHGECACMLSRFSHVRLCATLWTFALQVPLSAGSSRQEYWSGLPCPPPGDLPDQETEPVSLVSWTRRWVLYH